MRLPAWLLLFAIGVLSSYGRHQETGGKRREYRFPGEHPGFQWVVRDGEGYRLYYLEGGDVAPYLDKLAQLVPAARRRATSLMGVADTAPPIHLFLVKSRAQMKELAGREANGMTLPQHHAILMVFSGAPNVLAIRHETMHVLTHALWPAGGQEPWVREGLGVLAGEQCSGYSPRGVAYYLLEHDQLPSLADLRAKFWELDELAGHLASGSFMQFVYETYGSSGLRALWLGGLAELERYTDRSRSDLESGWHSYLAGTGAEAALRDWSRVAKGCYWMVRGESDGA
jgi:hypothetical protein